jgi:hypothetical protein
LNWSPLLGPCDPPVTQSIPGARFPLALPSPGAPALGNRTAARSGLAALEAGENPSDQKADSKKPKWRQDRQRGISPKPPFRSDKILEDRGGGLAVNQSNGVPAFGLLSFHAGGVSRFSGSTGVRFLINKPTKSDDPYQRRRHPKSLRQFMVTFPTEDRVAVALNSTFDEASLSAAPPRDRPDRRPTSLRCSLIRRIGADNGWAGSADIVSGLLQLPQDARPHAMANADRRAWCAQVPRGRHRRCQTIASA